MKNLEIWNEFDNSLPIIVSIPHSGTDLPISMKKNLLDNVILSNMDWYLIELYSFFKDLHITTIVNNISRYVIDTNREIVDNSSDSYTKNYIYTKTTFGYESILFIDDKDKTNTLNDYDYRIKNIFVQAFK